MISLYEKPLDPPCNVWSDYKKNEFLTETVKKICKNIKNHGESTEYQEIFDMIYIHIEENINDFYPKVDHDIYD